MADETRTETDSLGSIDIAAERYWGPQTERARRLFRIGTEHFPPLLIRAVGLHKWACAEANERLGRTARRARRPDPPGGAGDRRWAARRRLPAARLADRLRHPDQHECQRGHLEPRQRAAGLAAGQPQAGASERPRQPRPVLERQLPDHDAHRRRRGGGGAPHPGAGRAARRALAPVGGMGRHHQDRPHPSDGCGAGHPRPGIRRLGAAGRTRHRAAARRHAAAALGPPGRHRGRHRPQPPCRLR